MNNELDLAAIRKKLENEQGPQFWRSLDQLADTEEFQEFLHKEFPRQAAPLEGAVDRRGFLKFLGASLALAGLTACARPVSPDQKIVPYVRQPEEVVPGRPLFFASAISNAGYAEGVLVESHQGRPTKVEGNPDHPASLGATATLTQATVLSLYDPDRSRQITHQGSTSDWEALGKALNAALSASGDGTGVRLLTETVTSPTLAAQIRAFLDAYPAARWVQYDPLANRSFFEGTRLAFGQPLMPDYDFSQADTVVSLDADFVNDFPGRLRYANQFSSRRRIRNASDNLSRFYAFESTPSPTGSIADHRVPATPAAIAALASIIAARSGVDVAEAALPAGISAELVDAVVSDLLASRGRSIVVAGPYQSPEVQALAHAINDALGNTGATVTYLEPAEAEAATAVAPLATLVDEITAGEVELLLMLGTNPVQTAPAGIGFKAAIGRVPLSVHLGMYFDETAVASTWHVPQTHYLETWGDLRAFDGTITISQPLMSVLYGGKSELEVMALLRGTADATAYGLVREYWQNRVSGSFDAFWRDSVYRGVVADSRSAAVAPALQALPAPQATSAGLVVQFRPDPSIGDGRWANNGWLQEVPKPFTKLVWDNAAIVAPATAEEFALQNGDLVELTVDGRSLEAPTWILPGQAPGVITLNFGFGRSSAGRIATGLGFNAADLRSSEDTWTAAASLRKTGSRYQLVTTQTHHSLDHTEGGLGGDTGAKRHIIRAGTLAEFRAEPETPLFVHPVPHAESDLYPDYEYNSYKWGMVIDMNVCTGCNACVVACQAENNVPIVGKDQVAVGREMHWLRIDNYYSGSVDNPQYYHQPMLCQHCEKAPCEPVCPVGATVHDHEGLNVMVYNRCVGTRYCSNNCPYKVRRFNYLQYAELSTDASPESLAYNPDVTVRSRGVMEKCTFCTQRISKARIDANNEVREIRDGEVVTACQAACPMQAIVFGDLNDPASAVSANRKSPLNYTPLEELNTFPRNTYVARVKNVNPQAVEGSVI
jgi:molybdopterin-containing oxidoreductase family iron-sulfur binding subunit